jgi:ferredoxin-type protein NapH
MTWLHTHRYWLLRRTTQLGILALFWLAAHHHLGVLTGDLSSSRVLRTIPLADPYAVLQILAAGQWLASTVLIGAAIVLLFYLAVGGRSYCAWVCPVNLVTDFADWLKRRFHLTSQFRVDPRTRFWIMGLALPVSALTGVAAFEWLSPIGILTREIVFGAGLGLLVVAVILIIDLGLVKGGWCGALCPLGAFYALLGRFALLRVAFDAKRCDACRDCIPVCREKQVLDFARMEARGFIDSGDCMNCARCLELCPRDAYHFALRPVGGTASTFVKGDHHANKEAA